MLQKSIHHAINANIICPHVPRPEDEKLLGHYVFHTNEVNGARCECHYDI